nr:hypothetical protein [Candidatus Freyarchaeota archaeon]
MSKGALLTGVAGGIIGAITTGLGIAWMLISLAIASDLWILLFGPTLFYVALSILTGALIVVTCILTGIGFYGVGQIGGGAMGTAAMIIGIVLGSASGILLVLGLVVAGILAAISTITLMVTFIIFGTASISMRESTMNPSASLAAGIISIIGGVFVFIFGIIGYGLMFVSFIIWAIVFYSSREA